MPWTFTFLFFFRSAFHHSPLRFGFTDHSTCTKHLSSNSTGSLAIMRFKNAKRLDWEKTVLEEVQSQAARFSQSSNTLQVTQAYRASFSACQSLLQNCFKLTWDMEISKVIILTMFLFLYSSENCSVFAGKERYLNQVFSNTPAIYIPQVSCTGACKKDSDRDTVENVCLVNTLLCLFCLPYVCNEILSSCFECNNLYY